MLSIGNDELSVDLIDPADPAERSRLGTRFCWGGYIWQVLDKGGAARPRDANSLSPGSAPNAITLLTGPEWPKADPIPFNGQGAPESFRHAAWPTQRPLTLVDGRGFILGVGDVKPGPDGSPVVDQPCPWEISLHDQSLTFRTNQSALGWECALERTVSLAGRTLTSASRLVNKGTRPLPLHWFAHPFFALTDGLLTCDLPPGYGFDENPGFLLDAKGRLSFKRRFLGKDDGQFQLLKIPEKAPLAVTLSHPRLAFVRFSTDFVPDLCPVWGNGSTWSIEPYITTTLSPGESRAWHLRYDFGPRLPNA